MFVFAFSDVNLKVHTATLRFSSISLLSFSDGWKTTPRVMDNLTMPLVYGQPKKGWCYMYRHPQHHHPVLFSPRDCMDRSCLTRGSRNFYWKNQRGGRGAIVNPKWPHQTGSGPARTHCGTWWCVQPPEVIDNINRRGGDIYHQIWIILFPPLLLLPFEEEWGRGRGIRPYLEMMNNAITI